LTHIRFKQVDVFTRTPFRGNPVAVVLDGRGLATEEMQHIASWTNLSETTFVLPPNAQGADYRVRIFAPRYELPFAGHPTIGTAHAVLEAGIVKPRAGRFRQECGAGVLELSVEDGLIWVKSPPHKMIAFDAARRGELEAALGARVLGEPFAVDVGPSWLVAEVAGAEELARMPLSLDRIARLSDALKITGITVFGKSADGRSAVHVRSFAPAQAIPEDPVCGSGNISVAAYLAQAGRAGTPYRARQGMQLGRDGLVSLRVEGGGIFLGGHAVTCVEGSLRV
jgi:PhzF family phenazine biosynthesis protein